MSKLIYALKCPFTGEIHYIGKSTQGMLRPLQHMKESHNNKVKEWVEQLQGIGQKPDIEILENVSAKENIDERERMWIQRSLDKGDNLLNSHLVTPLLLESKLDKLLEDEPAMNIDHIFEFIKQKRKATGLSQAEFADKAGVGLRLIRDIEQKSKANFQTESLLQILAMFGCTLDVRKINRGS